MSLTKNIQVHGISTVPIPMNIWPGCAAQPELRCPSRAAPPCLIRQPHRATLLLLPPAPLLPCRAALAATTGTIAGAGGAVGSAGGAGGAAGSAGGAGGAAKSAGGAAGSAGGAARSIGGAGDAAGSAGGAATVCHGFAICILILASSTLFFLLNFDMSLPVMATITRGSPGGGGFGFMGTAQRRQQRPQGTFSLQRLRDCASQRCVPGCVEAAALGASEYAAALGARESAAALGTSASTATGPASAEALHTFTLDSSASRCFFRDCTTVTPLASPVPVSLANPTRGPIVARASTVLPCPAVSLRSPPPFILDELVEQRSSPGCMGQATASSHVSASGQLAASCSCRLLSHQTLLWHHRLGHPSLPRLRSMHSRLLVSGLPRSLPPLPRSPAPPCLPCVEGRQHAAPHSFEFPPTTAPLQTLHMDVWGPAPVSGTDQERYFVLVIDDYTRYTTVFPLRRKADVNSVLIP
ncbi:unnamed protein product [Closterium sp. NIES-54]